MINILSSLEVPLGLLLFGALLACLGLMLLGEYRKLFLANPRAWMSFEVLTQMTQPWGSPAYMGVSLLFCSVFFLIPGVFSLCETIYSFIADGWHILFPG